MLIWSVINSIKPWFNHTTVLFIKEPHYDSMYSSTILKKTLFYNKFYKKRQYRVEKPEKKPKTFSFVFSYTAVNAQCRPGRAWAPQAAHRPHSVAVGTQLGGRGSLSEKKKEKTMSPWERSFIPAAVSLVRPEQSSVFHMPIPWTWHTDMLCFSVSVGLFRTRMKR